MRSNTDNWNVKNSSSYQTMLPKNIIDGYKVSNGIFTTYSLDMQVLNELFLCLNCEQIMKNGIDVFYDVQGLRMDKNDYKPVSEIQLHGVNLYEQEQKYAFHPKVILLRYVNVEQGQIRYVMIVSSKNITTSNFLDAFCVVYGDVRKSPNGENVDNNNEIIDSCNGKQVFGFIERLYKKTGCKESELYKIWNELKNVNFLCADERVKSIKFFSESEINKQQLEKLKDMIVVSPFLSDGFVQKKNIKKIISTAQGFGSLKDELIDNRCYQIVDGKNTQLHAKVYYGMMEDMNGDKGNSLCILGSSNATNNGCLLDDSVNPSGRNIEFNVALETSEEEYKQFENCLATLITSDIVYTESDKSKDDNRHVLGKFLQELDRIVIEKKDSDWQLTMKYKEDMSSYKLKLSIYSDGNYKWICVDGKATTITVKDPTDIFLVRVETVQERVKEYSIRIAPYIKNAEGDGKEYLSVLEEMHNSDFCLLIKKLIDDVFAHPNTMKHYSLKKELAESKQQIGRKRDEKQYIFEKLKKLALETWKEVQFKSESKPNEQKDIEMEYEQKYKEKLQKLEEYLNVIQNQDEESKTMLNVINIIMKGK